MERLRVTRAEACAHISHAVAFVLWSQHGLATHRGQAITHWNAYRKCHHLYDCHACAARFYSAAQREP